MSYPFEGEEALRAPIDAALRSVVDPELALNVVDLGLIYGVVAGEDAAEVRLTMTSAACPVTDLILSELEGALARVLPDGARVALDLVWQPAWQPEMMSDRAKAVMGW